ncbi:hypothetical protein BD410DRAFT_868676 [Rickenella mellea]|uniref:Uncharacterized protein n=1 Tax=Rickenella mellea TaxID=50990 RepID=A0A4Y7PES5_9AGAM|nr:hypothetical protein BD410DRAFT_868676 [Rickenella mellea]
MFETMLATASTPNVVNWEKTARCQGGNEERSDPSHPIRMAYQQVTHSKIVVPKLAVHLKEILVWGRHSRSNSDALKIFTSHIPSYAPPPSVTVGHNDGGAKWKLQNMCLRMDGNYGADIQ